MKVYIRPDVKVLSTNEFCSSEIIEESAPITPTAEPMF